MKSYRIIKVKKDPITYRASVPIPDGTLKIKQFSSKEYTHPLGAARQWQQKTGIAEWGMARWNLITQRRLSQAKGNGVYCFRGYTNSKDGQTRYYQWIVGWRIQGGKQKTKIFSVKRYGSEKKAQKMASLFAAQVRAMRSCSDLNLPYEIKL
ncbi:AP2 domain-containing protein [Vibrio cholerae]